MDARQVLGIGYDAGDEEIRAAYLRKIKEHPPETSPEQFEKIRDSYETLRDPRRRARDLLLSADPETPLVSLLDGQKPARRHAGPLPWLQALKQKRAPR